MIGVIIGANVDTGRIVFCIEFNLSEYALFIMGVGSISSFFKKECINNIGQIVFGFGCLFYGLKLMGNGIVPLKDMPQFADLMVGVSDFPILGRN